MEQPSHRESDLPLDTYLYFARCRALFPVHSAIMGKSALSIACRAKRTQSMVCPIIYVSLPISSAISRYPFNKIQSFTEQKDNPTLKGYDNRITGLVVQCSGYQDTAAHNSHSIFSVLKMFICVTGDCKMFCRAEKAQILVGGTSFIRLLLLTIVGKFQKKLAYFITM